MGPEGYRELASPVPGAFVNDLLSSIHTQGVPGSYYPPTLPNVFVYDETLSGAASAGYVPPATLAAPAGAGRGYLVYVYEDDDPGLPGPQGSFPKTLSVTPGPLVTGPFAWGGSGGLLTYTDTGLPTADGWNLLGNPFAGWLDWDATASTGLDASVYVLDGPSATYRAYSRGVGGTLPGGVIGAFSGFWVHATAPAPTLVAEPSPSSGGPFYGRDGASGPRIALRLAPSPGGALPDALVSETLLALDVEGALEGVSPLDAVSLLPPMAAYVLLGTLATHGDGTPMPLTVDTRPALTGRIEIGLDVRAVGADGAADLVLTWPRLDHVPDEWRLTLVDRVTGHEIDLRTTTHYPFSLMATGRAMRTLMPGPQVARADGSTRFALVVDPGVVVGTPSVPPIALVLAPPHPNPTRSASTMTLDLPEASAVRVVVVDALGRTVAVVAEGERPSGRLALQIGGDLSPGLYTVRAEVAAPSGAAVLTQRLVVVR
jgi:hypothetical protein